MRRAAVPFLAVPESWKSSAAATWAYSAVQYSEYSEVQYSTVQYLGVAVGVVAESRCLLLPRLLASSARWSQCGDPGDLHLGDTEPDLTTPGDLGRGVNETSRKFPT